LDSSLTPLIERIRQTYRDADEFLQPAPHMTMPDLTNRVPIGPIARIGTARRSALARCLGKTAGRRVALYSLGGVRGPSEVSLPILPDTHWIVTDPRLASRPDVTSAHRLGWPFEDVVASVDAIVGKDSYGTVVEALCAGVPLVVLCREGWPETPFLLAWAERNGRISVAENEQSLTNALELVGKAPPKRSVAPTGIEEAVEKILRWSAR
ncbi:MAG: hypothetical protein O9272_17135, partial [Brevundimonas sp.]|nr:hypothetical protein [Brevundimonas sp.]